MLIATKGIKDQDDAAMKAILHRIVAMLTRMAMKFDGVAESSAGYHTEIDYEHEHRDAEHEHEVSAPKTPEPYGEREPPMTPREKKGDMLLKCLLRSSLWLLRSEACKEPATVSLRRQKVVCPLNRPVALRLFTRRASGSRISNREATLDPLLTCSG